MKADEIKVITAYIRGDSNALGEVYSKYHKKIYSILLKYLQNISEAEDHASKFIIDELPKILSGPAGLAAIREFSPWLGVVVRNYCYKLLRKKSDHEAVEFSNSEVRTHIGPEQGLEITENDQVDESNFENLPLIDKLGCVRPKIVESIGRGFDYILAFLLMEREGAAAFEAAIPYHDLLRVLRKTHIEVKRILSTPLHTKMNELYEKYRGQLAITDPKYEFLLKTYDLKEPIVKYGLLRRHFEGNVDYPSELETLNKLYSNNVKNKLVDMLMDMLLEEAIREVEKRKESPGYPKFIYYSEDFMGFLHELGPFKKRGNAANYVYAFLHKAIKKGRYANRAYIEKLILEYKQMFRGTYLDDLFIGIDEHTNFDTIRKKMYRKSKSKANFDAIIDHIYRKSFIEEISVFAYEAQI